MESSNTVVKEAEVIPVVDPTNDPAVERQAKINALKGQLRQLQVDKQVVVEFKNAVFDSTHHGKHARAVAIGLEFLSSILLEGSNRIDAMLAEINRLEKESK